MRKKKKKKKTPHDCTDFGNDYNEKGLFGHMSQLADSPFNFQWFGWLL